MNFQNVSPRASDPLFKEATELWHNLRSLSEWSIPLRMMGNQLLCTCSAPWLPLEGSSLVMTLGCEWSDRLECERDHSVQLCTHITLFKWLLLSTTNLTLGWEWCCVLWRVHMIIDIVNWSCPLLFLGCVPLAKISIGCFRCHGGDSWGPAGPSLRTEVIPIDKFILFYREFYCSWLHDKVLS